MSLFDQASERDEFTWTAEALSQGIIKPGQWMEVAAVIATANGAGYILRCEVADGQEVYDYAFKKSKPGKTLKAIFDDPTVADGQQLRVKAQDKIRCAVCDSVDAEGLIWVPEMEDGKEMLIPTLAPKTGSKGGRQPKA